MTRIITWNIQCGRGVDGRIDLMRIADVIKDMADADVICLQEVSRFNPGLDGGKGADQVADLAAYFPEHQPIFGAALDRAIDGARHRAQFGNLFLSRLPIIQAFCHLLPQPAPPNRCVHMPRQALEVVVDAKDGPLRITTTHLEYHCVDQRLAQATRLREIHSDVLKNQDYGLTAPATGPYAATPRPARSIICGDFNSVPDDAVYQSLTTPTSDIHARFMDAWRVANGHVPHPATCGSHDRKQWPEGPHCRDFFFLTDELTAQVEDIQVQKETDASDHQPIMLNLEPLEVRP